MGPLRTFFGQHFHPTRRVAMPGIVMPLRGAVGILFAVGIQSVIGVFPSQAQTRIHPPLIVATPEPRETEPLEIEQAHAEPKAPKPVVVEPIADADFGLMLPAGVPLTTFEMIEVDSDVVDGLDVPLNPALSSAKRPSDEPRDPESAVASSPLDLFASEMIESDAADVEADDIAASTADSATEDDDLPAQLGSIDFHSLLRSDEKRKTDPEFLSPAVMIAPKDPWWADRVSEPLRKDAATIPVDVDQLFALAAEHSGRVQAVAQVPWVNRMQIAKARGAFDPVMYTDSRFDSTSDPVENSLTTGGPPRLEDNILGIDAGLRGLTSAGTQYNVGQRVGHKNSNSTFFLPNNQGSARMFANLTHPLMRGRQVNAASSLVVSAQFDTSAAEAKFQETLQKQLYDVAGTYWSLYFQRSSLLQRQRHLARAEEIYESLISRIDHDTNRSQALRARASVATRHAELAQNDTRIRNLESQLRAQCNAPELLCDRNAEIVPVQIAADLGVRFDIEPEVATALVNRPELQELEARLAAAHVQLRLANDQTKARLDLVAEGYLAGRQGDSDIAGAWSDQFSEGRPGYAAGLVFERPIRNRTAKATVSQRRFEIRQIENLMTEQRETIRSEVETAVRDIDAGITAIARRSESLRAVAEEVDYLKSRWLVLGDDSRVGPIQLDELLRAQDRLLQEEQALLQARVAYQQTLLELQRSTGRLIRFAE